MNKNKLLVFFSTYCWPILRVFIRTTKRCKLCILSEKYVEMNNGVCSICRDYKNEKLKKPEELHNQEDMLKEFNQKMKSVSKSGQYDALLLLSGGKDSAYILKRIRDEFPSIKVLCLFVENGFSSEYAIQNAVYLTNKLKTDLIISNEEIEEFYSSFKDAFVNLKGRGSSGIVDFADGTKIFEIGKTIAKKMSIPFVIGGLSWTQVRNILKNDSFIIDEPGGPSLISPLAVWRTSEFDIRENVRENKLVLKGSDNPIVSNNELIVTMCAIDVLNSGYCSFEPEFAQMVREGKANRKVWLHNFELLEFATNYGILKKDIDRTLLKLNLKLNDVIKI